MRKMKKLWMTLGTVSLVGALCVGATLAYFTDKEETVNTVTFGRVDITLTEPEFSKNENNTIDKVEPNQTIVKDPVITLEKDSEDAYVRAAISVNGLTGEKAAAVLASIEADMDESLWYKADGYYYYKDKLTKEALSAAFFGEFSIPEEWNNEEADISFTIDVSAEAIQADNFTPVRNADGMITAWMTKDGMTPITAESYEK